MKTSIILIAALLFTSIAIAQSQKLTFAFDAAGNQTTRTWVCVNCPTSAEMTIPDKGSDPNDSVSNVMSSVLPIELTVDAISETTIIGQLVGKPELKEITVTDSNQIPVRSTRLSKNSGISKIDFSRLPRGKYLLKARLADETDHEIEITKI